MGGIRWKTYHVDSPEYNGKPLELIKAKWEEFELGCIYLVRIYAGSMYLALIQKYSHHTYGSVFIIAYALTNPIYARLINNVWTEQQNLITNTDLFSVHFIAQTLNGYVEYFDARIKSDMNCVASIKYSSVVLNYILNVQVHNGSLIIYVRTPEGTIPQDNTNINIYAIFAK